MNIAGETQFGNETCWGERSPSFSISVWSVGSFSHVTEQVCWGWKDVLLLLEFSQDSEQYLQSSMFVGLLTYSLNVKRILFFNQSQDRSKMKALTLSWWFILKKHVVVWNYLLNMHLSIRSSRFLSQQTDRVAYLCQAQIWCLVVKSVHLT